MSVKRCSRCGKLLPFINFYKDKNKTCGLTSECKSCRNLYRKEYRKTGVNRKREWSINTLAKHRERGYEIVIDTTQLTELAEETIHCKWCGRKLHWDVGEGFLSTNPTLDREDCELDITIDNVAIICHSCNVSKGQMNSSEFRQYIKRMYEVTILGG